MRRIVQFSILCAGLLSCIDDSENPGTRSRSGDWLIPVSSVFDGGPGKDGIPALTNTEVVSTSSASLDYLSNEDLVLVYKSGTEMKAYPHRILDWHEIANDQVGEDELAVVYCPLTGTGLGWGRELNGQTTTFGVSGLLYETNIMPYDRLTDSYWNQMFDQCVNGELIGETPEFFPVTQMSFGSLKEFYPNALVATTNTGFSRDYSRYPYGSYLTNTQTLFPVSRFDETIHPKEFVLGIVINEDAAAFRFPGTGRSLHVATIGGEEVVVVADKENSFIVPFLVSDFGDGPLNFTLIEDTNSSAILTDQLGNEWNIFGEAISGPNQDTRLQTPYSYMGFWFAWSNFYQEIRLIE